MKWFVTWLLNRMHWATPLAQNQAEVRIRCGLLEGWVSVAVNTVIGVAKLFLGFGVQSSGLIADSIHSLSDTASSVVVIIGFYAAAKPPDAEHPFGHAKAEHIATLVLSVMLVFLGLELFLAGFKGWWDGVPSDGLPLPQLSLMLWLGSTVVLKELLARFSFHIASLVRSDTLTLDGWHHRSDALSTIAVMGGLLGRHYGWFALDHLAGIGIGLWIVWIGIAAAKKVISPLLGEGARQSDLDHVRQIASQVPHVHAVHDLRMHKYGEFHFTTLHIELPDYLDIHAMHRVTVQIEMRILEHFVGECVVHIDPVNTQHPLYSQVYQVLDQLKHKQPDMVDFRDLHFGKEGQPGTATVEVVVAARATQQTREAVRKYLQTALQKEFVSVAFRVHITHDHSAPAVPSHEHLQQPPKPSG